jgi:ABC-type multidrug transport system fused ATPase/permease subunit
MQKNKEKSKNESLLFSLNRLRFLFNRRDKVFFIILLIGMIIGAFLETFSIGAIPIFISAVINPEKILQYELAGTVLNSLGITTSRDILLWGCLSLLLIFSIKTAYLCLQYYFQVRYVQNRRFRLTRRLFSAYMNAPYQFHIQRNSAELFRNTVLEVNEIMAKVLMPLLTLTMQGMIMVAILALLFAVQPFMALVAGVLLGFAGGGFQWFVKKKLVEYSLQAQEYRECMIKSIQQGLGVIKELRILHTPDSDSKYLQI